MNDSRSIPEQIKDLSQSILFDLARNESANHEFRKAAVQILLDKHSPQAGHPELAFLVTEIRKEQEALGEVETIVESAIESEIPHLGAPAASFTTASMMQDEYIRNPSKLGDDAL